MNGRIKWFSAGKGYGFITETSGAQYYFNAFDFKIEGGPRAGDSVVFTPVQNQKGQRAAQVCLVPPATSSVQSGHSRDSRVECVACHKQMVPRILTGPPLGATRRWTPVPKRSMCPFCASTHEVFPPSRAERITQIVQWILSCGILIAMGAGFWGMRWH